MNYEKEISKLKEKLTKIHAKRRRENYIKDAPHTPNLFDGLYMTKHQIKFVKKLNAFDERAYAKFLRKAPSDIRRWAMQAHNVPRSALKAVTQYGLQLDIQAYKGLTTKRFISLL